MVILLLSNDKGLMQILEFLCRGVPLELKTKLDEWDLTQNSPKLVIADPENQSMDFHIHLRRMHEHAVPVLYLHSESEYAYKILRQANSEFLRKPFNLQGLQNCLESMSQKYFSMSLFGEYNSQDINQRIMVWDKYKWMALRISDILKIKSDGSYSQIFLKNEKVIFTCKGIGYFEEQLKGKNFVRIHNRCLINSSHISYYRPGAKAFVELSDSEIEYVSKSKKKILLQHFQDEI